MPEKIQRSGYNPELANTKLDTPPVTPQVSGKNNSGKRLLQFKKKETNFTYGT